MNTTLYRIHSSILGVGAALLVPFLAAATVVNAPPSGNYTNSVSDPTNAVWDFGGGAITTETINVSKGGTTVQATIPTDFTQSGQGKISASETDVSITPTLDSAPFTFPATVTEKGSITSSGKGTAHLIFSVTATGTGTLPSAPQPSKVTLGLQINATINSTDETIFGTRKGSASASGIGGISETTTFSNTLAAITDETSGNGSWTLTLNNLSTSNNAVTGTATIKLNSGQVFNYNVKGVFSSTKGTKLVLTGSNPISVGSAIQVTLDLGNSVTNIKGKISGQSVNASF